MDLGQFAGHTITLYFRTWQDGAFTLQMMYVDDIVITGMDFSDDVEAGSHGWISPAAGDTGQWTIGTGLVPNNWHGDAHRDLVGYHDPVLEGPQCQRAQHPLLRPGQGSLGHTHEFDDAIGPYFQERVHLYGVEDQLGIHHQQPGGPYPEL